MSMRRATLRPVFPILFLTGLLAPLSAAAQAIADVRVRLMRREPGGQTRCGEWAHETWEACGQVHTCEPKRVGAEALGQLLDRIESSFDHHATELCKTASCGAPARRKDENSWECVDPTRLCVTRTVEFSCRRAATSSPEGSPGAPGSAERPARRPSPPPGARRSDPIEPEPSRSTARPGAAPRTAPTTARRGTAFDFPGHAEHQDSGEYWFWKAPDDHGDGSQKYAYDLTSARFDDASGRWTECTSNRDGTPKCTFCSDARRNEDCLVYGESLYAMAPGTVIRCWRNAPQNPRPGESHPERAATPPRIGGGGNALVVEHDDGTVALYAHMQTGSIPASLCPISAELMNDATDTTEVEIPVGQQPRLARGQFVGLVGNSGKSGNPHVHVHVQDGPDKTDAGVPLDFRGGFISEAKAESDLAWSRLDGRTRPVAHSVIWPNYSKGFPEIARHGVRAEDYQRVFDHVAGSGYRLAWIDGFESRGRLYFNVVFRPSDGSRWAAVHNLTGEQFQQEFDRRSQDGFRMKQVEAYTRGDRVLYAAIFAAGGPDIAAYHGRSAAEHQREFDELTRAGWRPRNVSVVSTGGRRIYAALYEKRGGGGIFVKSALTGAQYQEEFDRNSRAGRQLSYLNAYVHEGQPYFTAIWEEVSGKTVAGHGLTGADYQREWSDARAGGLLTGAVTGYDSGGRANYAAYWRR